jgi:hypothetical protein
MSKDPPKSVDISYELWQTTLHLIKIVFNVFEETRGFPQQLQKESTE